MVFVKVRETYDLHTIANKMTVIGVHTPNNSIIKRNYPGLLMNCKQYRPVSCDIRMACASMLPLDPLGVGITEGDVAPEDVFNPILYKAVSNKSMSQIEQFLNRNNDAGWTARGDSLDATNDGILTDDFDLYYGLLSNTHDWKHANPQSGLEMRSVRPLVYEMLYSIGDSVDGSTAGQSLPPSIGTNGVTQMVQYAFKGKAHPIPFLNCTVPTSQSGSINNVESGFGGQVSNNARVANYQVGVPAPKVMCACLCIPPSRRHQLFYRLVIEWTLEFIGLRPLSEITSWAQLATIGNSQHVMDYDFGDSKFLLESTDLVDTSEGSEIQKVM